MINPDEKLKLWLDDQIVVQVSDTETRKVLVYHQGSRPNKNLPDEFIEILYNGSIKSLTKPIGFIKGDLAVTVYCKTQSDGTVKHKRVKSILSQLGQLVSNKVIEGFFYEFNLNNIITPLYINYTNGYSTITLNISWRTSDSQTSEKFVALFDGLNILYTS